MSTTADKASTRVLVGFKPDEKELIAEMSKLTRVSESALVAGIVRQQLPKLRESLEKIKNAQGVIDSLLGGPK